MDRPPDEGKTLSESVIRAGAFGLEEPLVPQNKDMIDLRVCITVGGFCLL